MNNRLNILCVLNDILTNYYYHNALCLPDSWKLLLLDLITSWSITHGSSRSAIFVVRFLQNSLRCDCARQSAVYFRLCLCLMKTNTTAPPVLKNAQAKSTPKNRKVTIPEVRVTLSHNYALHCRFLSRSATLIVLNEFHSFGTAIRCNSKTEQASSTHFHRAFPTLKSNQRIAE